MHVHDLANSHKVFKSEKGFNSDDLHSRLAFVKYFKNCACKWLLNDKAAIVQSILLY